MKRPLEFFGFSSAITLLMLNAFCSVNTTLIILSAVVMFSLSLLIRRLRQEKVVPIVFGAALFSCLVFVLVMNNSVLPQLKLAENNDKVRVIFHIIKEPEETTNGVCYEVKTDYIEVENAPQNIKLKLYTRYELEADYYDKITADLSFKRLADNAFDSYSCWGENLYLKAGCYGDYSVSEVSNKPLNFYAIKAREAMKRNLNSCLSDEASSLSYAILTGDKSYIDEEILSNFKICGVSHIMAVSGLHIAIICTSLYLLLRRFGVKDYILVPFTVALSLMYIAVSGYSKSVLRAAIMLFVFLFGKLIGKYADSLNSLGLAVFIICLNPFAVTDASAVLTVTAVIGILVIKPKLDKKVNKITKKLIGKKNIRLMINKFLGVSTGTISVMLSTFPAVCLFFGAISFIQLFVSIVIFLLIEFIVIFSLISSMVGGNSFISAVPAFITEHLDSFLLVSVKYFAEHFRLLYLDVSSDYYIVAISITLLFIAFSLIIFRKIKAKQAFAFFFIALFISSMLTVYDYNSKGYMCVSQSDALIFYDKHCSVVINADKQGDLYSVKNAVSYKQLQKIIFINCDIDKERLEKMSDCEKAFFNNSDFAVDLCDEISVKCIGDKVEITMFDETLSVEDNRISVNDDTFIRNKGNKFSDFDSYTIYFSNSRQSS